MKPWSRPAIAILASTVWVSLNEFVRNQVVLAERWTRHYQDLGLTFPARPINGAVWGLWALLFSVAVHAITRKYTLLWSGAWAWLVGFGLMWVVIGNLGVLPDGILAVAGPWSVLEAFGAAWIIRRFGPDAARS